LLRSTTRPRYRPGVGDSKTELLVPLFVRRMRRIFSRPSRPSQTGSRDQCAAIRSKGRSINKWLLTAVRRVGLAPLQALVNLRRGELVVPAWRDLSVVKSEPARVEKVP